MHFLFVIFLVTLSLNASANPATCTDLFSDKVGSSLSDREKSIEISKQTVEENTFMVNRTLFDYIKELYLAALGKDHQYKVFSFGSDLAHLNSNHRVIDFGSGQSIALKGILGNYTTSLRALYANMSAYIKKEYGSDLDQEFSEKTKARYIREKIISEKFSSDFLPLLKSIISRPLRDKPNLIGITYKMSGDNVNQYDSKLQIMKDRYFEDIPDSEIPRYDLGVSYYGVFSYTNKISQDLFKALNKLNVGGRLYIYGMESYIANREEVLKTETDLNGFIFGKKIGEYLSAESQGIRVYSDLNNTKVIVIERTDQPLKIPLLNFVKVFGKSMHPPQMFYQPSGGFIE